MATLQVAFYRFWGIPAFVAGVNAEDPQFLDHAVAIVYIGETPEEYQELLGDMVSWEFAEGETIPIGYGIEEFPSGSYMLVDNAYSDTFGALTDGLPENKFEIYCIAPDDAPYDDAWDEFLEDCASVAHYEWSI